MKNFLVPLSKLLMLFFLAILPSTVVAASDDDVAKRKIRYDCEEQAATFTKNMGKAGDEKLYQQHLKDCLAIAAPAPILGSSDIPVVVKCKDDEYKFTFKNNSKETIWLGVWDTKGFTAPAHWPDWQLDAAKENSWCAPHHFNGRFMVRADCDTKTGICKEGNCCSDSGKCGGMICNTGVQPTSLVEFNFDNNDKDKLKNPLGVTWYDVSYVDGYNFPLAINTNNEASCKPLGQGDLPDCPWPTVDNICLAPYKQYEIDRPWYNYEQPYYILAAKCAYQGTDNNCGCGDLCPAPTPDDPKHKLDRCENTYPTKAHPETGLPVTLHSSGCSPFNDYLVDPGGLAKTQTVCNPFKPKKAGDKCFEWPSTPRDYKLYASNINKVSPKAYTWQYHDDDSLTSCPSKAGNAFTVTISERPGNKTNGNGHAVAFSPTGGLTGHITVENDPPQNFSGPNKLRRMIKNDDKINITSVCDPDKKTLLSCSATYNIEKGLIPDANADCTGEKSGINWNNPKENNGQLFSFGKPDSSVCKDPDDLDATNFNIYAGTDFKGSAQINDKPPFMFNGNFMLRLHEKDSVKMWIDCKGGGTLDCTAIYDAKTGLLTLDKNKVQKNCENASATIGWGKDKNALHPPQPDAVQCKK